MTSNTTVSLNYDSIRFPQSLLQWKHYNGIRLIAAFVFVLAVGYFFFGFLPHNQTWMEWFINKIPILGSALGIANFLWRLFILGASYCFLWLTFDHRMFAGYAMSAFSILLGVVYLLSPLDFIPDIIPVFGMVDDATVSTISALIGFRCWANATSNHNTMKRVWAALENGDRQLALELLLNNQGITLK